MISVLQSKAGEIDKRYKQLTARHEVVLQDMQQKEITDADVASMLKSGRSVSVGLANPTPELMRQWLE